MHRSEGCPVQSPPVMVQGARAVWVLGAVPGAGYTWAQHALLHRLLLGGTKHSMQEEMCIYQCDFHVVLTLCSHVSIMEQPSQC